MLSFVNAPALLSYYFDMVVLVNLWEYLVIGDMVATNIERLANLHASLLI